MTGLPNMGDTLRVWPLAGLRVQDGAGNFGRVLADSGREVVWDAWWHRRLLEGAVTLSDPLAKKSKKE